MNSALKWTTDKKEDFNGYQISVAENIPKQINHQKGIDRVGRRKKLKYNLLFPLIYFRSEFFVDGFIRRCVFRILKPYLKPGLKFLDVGCGNFKTYSAIPSPMVYNAFDMQFSDLFLEKIIKKPRVNLCLASITMIPLKENQVDLFTSTEVLEHIPEIETAVQEIWRVAKPGAIFICSIPNNFCYKYKMKGANTEHVNNWTFEGFKEFMKNLGFSHLQSFWKGYWVRLPNWLTKVSYQLPIRHKKEYYSTNFFYVFRVNK